MKLSIWSVAGLVVLACVTLVGCSNSAPSSPQATTSTTGGGDADPSRDGWWCVEHGVPEEVCALCDVDLAAGFKAKDDWCAEHDRPESQCFVCNPDQEQIFAAQYEAKFGTAPPARDGDSEEHGHDHEHGDDHEHDHDQAGSAT